MFKRKQERGEVPASADPDKLASQAEARIVNEVHNFAVVRRHSIAAALHAMQLAPHRKRTPCSKYCLLVSGLACMFGEAQWCNYQSGSLHMHAFDKQS